jgi:glycosyltransferase involved in cell wall biosynthesis
VSDSDLSLLLRGAELEVIPSLYEGFCLPMVEAMACGVPTIAANSSCLPEISGGVLRYFDPFSVEEMAACIQTVMDSRDLRAELGLRGKQCAQQFSWQLCAEQTLDVVERVARGSKGKMRSAGVAL